jgi:hypothetical protein
MIELPPGVGIVKFLRHDGRTPVPAAGNEPVAKAQTPDETRRRYQHLIPNQEQQAIGAVFD